MKPISNMKIALHEFLYKKNRQQQIKGFYYVALHSSISEAARMMHLTQSTVTLQIQSLERDLGFKLLNRDSKPLSLTQEGEDFYKIACPLMHEFESVVEKFLNRKKEKEQKKIDIAAHHSAISHMMPRIIAHLKKSHPDAKIMIRNIPTREAIKRLKDGQIDLAFYPNMSHEPELKHSEVISYDPILIMNKKHPLAKKPVKSLKDLKNFDLIRIDRNLIVLPLFGEAVRTHGIKGSVEFENGNWEMLKHFVKENNFVAIVSAVCLDKNDSDLVMKNLAKLFPSMSFGIAMKSGQLLKPIVQSLFDSFSEVAKEWKFAI
jgi:DNA-binding transcriptional LysR family regulator